MKGNRIDGGKFRGITGLRMGRDSHSVARLSGAVHVHLPCWNGGWLSGQGT